RLRIAGWMGAKNREYADGVFATLRQSGLEDAFEYVGEVDRRGKLDLLNSIDVLAVPTTYREPKGLFVLEALAAGVPVVQPDHGAFPEVLSETGGGLLHRPLDAEHLAQQLHELMLNAALRNGLAESGRNQVVENRNAQLMALKTVKVLQSVVRNSSAPENNWSFKHAVEVT
ncbi:MAG TPA: glycosyltransferase family 4 protein, partial [Pirellulaceae bacterium]|nr:glycosyltransferase family 4 protein [Pirellulaceae bacterium]